MSLVRERCIKIIETLPYELDKEILKKDTKEILKDITQRYINTYGTQDLSENDKECVRALIGNKI